MAQPDGSSGSGSVGGKLDRRHFLRTAGAGLAAASPLWDMPNVLISPHSASTADTENAKLTDLFCENLGRYVRGEALLNVFDRERLY